MPTWTHLSSQILLYQFACGNEEPGSVSNIADKKSQLIAQAMAALRDLIGSPSRTSGLQDWDCRLFFLM